MINWMFFPKNQFPDEVSKNVIKNSRMLQMQLIRLGMS